MLAECLNCPAQTFFFQLSFKFRKCMWVSILISLLHVESTTIDRINNKILSCSNMSDCRIHSLTPCGVKINEKKRYFIKYGLDPAASPSSIMFLKSYVDRCFYLLYSKFTKCHRYLLPIRMNEVRKGKNWPKKKRTVRRRRRRRERKTTATTTQEKKEKKKKKSVVRWFWLRYSVCTSGTCIQEKKRNTKERNHLWCAVAILKSCTLLNEVVIVGYLNFIELKNILFETCNRIWSRKKRCCQPQSSLLKSSKSEKREVLLNSTVH